MRSNRNKALLILVAIAVLVSVSVYATVAFFTDETSVTNTFTVGRVHITLDEAQVNTDGTPVTPANRTEEGNKYHLLPGKTYTKDPVLTVKGESDSAYVRMMVTITCANELTAAYNRYGASTFTPDLLLNNFGTGWTLHASYSDTTNNSLIFEYRYSGPVTPAGTDVRLPALFDSFTIPGAFDGADLASIASMSITVQGHAIQRTGFEGNEELAWQSFNRQLGNSSLPTVAPTATVAPAPTPTDDPSKPEGSSEEGILAQDDSAEPIA